MGYTVCPQRCNVFFTAHFERYIRTFGQALCHLPTAAALRFFRAAYYAPDGYGLPFPGRGLLAGRHSRSSSPRSASFAIWIGIAVLPCFSASAERRRRSLWSPFTGYLCRILAVFPLRLSHAHARLSPRKHLKRRCSVIARRTHPHAQFSASIVISM